MLRTILISFLLLSLSACSSDLVVSQGFRKKNKLSIEQLDMVSAKPGDQVRFIGKNLSSDLKIYVNGKPAMYIYIDENVGAFIVPEDVEPGLIDISFSMKDKEIVKYPLLNSEATSDLPIIPVPEENVCNTLIYKNLAGEIVRGKAACLDEAPCSKDAETGCLATDEVPAVSRADLEANIAAGVVLDKIAGTACEIKDFSGSVLLSGQPVGFSNAIGLNVSVSGSDLTQYKYKVRGTADSACSDADGYSLERSIVSTIDDDISALPDGNIEICVIALGIQGVWQPLNQASSVSWTKDVLAPTATISLAPTGTSNLTNLNVSVGDSDIIQYKYKVRETTTTACSDSADYSPAVAAGTDITDSIAALPDGNIEICVMGADAAGNWQPEAVASSVSWTKDTLAPLVLISGAPSGTNNASLLNVAVSGADVSHYKYKIRTTADPGCSSPLGYGSEAAVGNPLASDISTFPDGLIELCVIGRDSSGNWQAETTAATASWTKDSLPPAAILAGAPSGISRDTSLNITVSGTDVVEYKYKIRTGTDSSCAVSADYSAAIAVATPINDNIAAKADGTIQVCVLGKDNYGNWQLEGTATIASWTKDTTSPVATLADVPTGTSAATTLDITVGGADVTGYKYKIRESADSACSVAAGYSSEVAVGSKITSNISALADGAFELCVIGRDAAGNWQAEGSATAASWTKDTTAPTATVSGEPTGTSGIIVLNVAVAGSDVTHYKFKVRETTDPACSNAAGYSSEVSVATAITSNISTLSDGVIELCVVGRDATGNWQSEASATTASWTKDALPPAATLSGQPTGTSLATSLDITVGPADVVEYKYKIRESADASCTDSTGYSSAIAVASHITDDISAKADGVIEVCVIGKDASGNWQLEGVATAAFWTKDTAAPTATIADAPSATNNTTVLDVTVAGTDVTHYKYKVRESTDSACSVAAGYSSEVAVASKITSDISSLADGSFELCVIGRDAVGNWQAEASATTASWTKDTTAPTASVSGEPTGTNNVTVLNVAISGSGVTHYKYKVRDISDAACSNASGYSSEVAVATPITSDISGLSDGVLELCVIGRDTYGNWQAEASATTASWTKDALPPAATLSGQPTGTNLTTSLNITVGPADVVEYKYKIREATDASCSDSTGYSSAIAVATPITDGIGAKADGVIQVCVIGKDASGNWQLEGVATSASWTKDTAAPTATIADAPSATNNTTVLDVTVSGTDVTHYKYKVRESTDSACSVAAGYSSEVAVASKITSNISALADGIFELCVIGRDAAGNWQAEASATTASWTKDTTAPTASVSGEPTGTNNVTVLNVAVSGSGVTHYKYKVRDTSDAACSNASGYSSEVAAATPITSDISGLSDGVLELCVIGRDTYGNWQAEASATTASWTKDALPPAATLSGQPTGNSLSTSLDITVAGADVVEYKYKVRESTDASCTDSAGYSSAIAVATHITDGIAGLADGAIQVCVIAKDGSGNWQLEGTATTASWTKDTQAPVASVADQPTGTNGTTTLNVTVSGPDVTHYKYKLREAAGSACSNSAGYSSETAVASKITDSLSSLADGTIELCVVGRDAAGNWQTEASATAVSWTKDTTAPTATISGEPTGTNANSSLNVTIAGADVTHYKYKLRESGDLACSDGTGYGSETPVGTLITASIASLADGILQLCVIGKDSSGNWQAESSATTASWTKDSTAPLATISGAPGAASSVTSLDITIAGTDVVEYKYKVRTTADSACSVSTGYSSATAVATHITESIAAKADGAIEVCVIGKDSAGNWQLEANASTATWTKDTSAPTATLSDVPTGTNNAGILDVSVAGTDVSHYKYKLRETTDSACSVSTGYSSEIDVATKITNNIAAYADGVLELCVIGRDAAGNWQTEASATTASWTRDATAPTATISGQPTGTNNTTALNVSVAGAGVSHYKYKVRESADTACSDSADYSSEVAVATPITSSISAKADGTIELCVVGRDASGNWQTEATATTASWTKDSVAPTATISGNPTGSSLVTNLDITVAGTDVVEYKYKVRAAADSACLVTADYSAATAVATHITSDISGKADGVIEVCVIGKDAQGNWQTEATASAVTWTKDTLAPTATVSNAPTGTNNTTTLNITVAGTGVTEYKYKIRESATSACSNNAGYSSAVAVATAITDGISGFADGAMEVCVIGRDAAGNWQTEASATSVTWTKDATAPTVTLSGQPTGTNNTTTLNVAVAGSGVTHYKYKVRESADALCSDVSGYSSELSVATAITDSISAKGDGTIELCVVGRDTYGNWQAEASATAVTWTKDTAAPTAIISGNPTGSSLAATLDITISGTDVVEYKYKVRAIADSACSVSADYSSAAAVASHITSDISGKADGVIEVCVIGKDAQGNWQAEASASTVTWTKDTAAPTATISNAPAGTNNATTLNISVAGTGVTEYKYKVRGSATTACSNSAGYSSAVAVATAITDSISGFADGAMEICVIGRDAAGNWQAEASATSETWTKDTAAPIATVSGQPTGTNNTTTLNVTVAGSGVTHYKYKVRESADAVCSDGSGYSSETAVATAITDNITAKADGAFELCVIGRDASGNWQLEASATAVNWTKDTNAPTATISGNPTGTSLTTTLNITVAGTDVVEYKYKIRETADTACSVSTGYSSATAVATHITSSITAKADGTIEVCVIGKDSAGNWQLEASATSVTWTKDTSAPTATISGNPTGTNSTTTLNVTIAGTGVTEYKYKVRQSASTLCSNIADYSSSVAVANPITDSLSGLTDGTIEICVVGRDAAGNWQVEASATVVSWTKDTTAPTAIISGAPAGTNNSTTLNVTVSGTDVSHYKYKIRQNLEVACSNASDYSSEVAVGTSISDSISGLADGALELCVIGRDVNGNWQTEATAASANWTKDTVAPTATVSGAPTGTNNTTTLDMTVAGTGVVEYKYKIRASADAACSNSSGYGSAIAVATKITDSISAKADGTIEVCVIGKDSAGNWQLEATATANSWTKDTIAPTATISGAPTGTNTTTLLDVTIAGTGVTHYKYKIRASADSACSNSSDYSSEIPVASHITDSITGKADGTIELCVIARDSVGNYQLESAASTASWTKDTTPPGAVLSGSPSGSSGATTLNITVSGTDVVEYKYKIRESADSACSNSAGYSSAIAVGSHITDSISAKADGPIEVCVIGKDSIGNWQLEASAGTASWTKDTVVPAAPTSLFVAPRGSALKTTWTSGGGDTSGFVVLRRASATISDAPTAGTTYTIGSTIGSSTVAYAGASLSTTDFSLTNGTKYYYRIFAYDAAKNYSSGIIAWGRPVAHEPPSADDLIFWADSSYAESFFTDTGCATAVTVANETVACWKDLSSYAAILTQSSSGNRPVYKTSNIFGNSSLQHSGTHWLTATTSNLPSGNLQHSLVYIGSFGTTTTSGAIHIGGTPNDSKIRLFGDGGLIIYSFGNNDLRYTPPSTSPQVYLGTYNGINGTSANRKLYINGTEQTSVANSGVLTNTLNLPASPGITIGSNSTGTQGLTGDVGEFLIYEHDLSPSEIIDLGKYAWNKWNIPQITLSVASLPSGIALTWADGIASSSYLVVKRAGTPPTFVPSNGTSYSTGAQGSDTIVYASTAKNYTDGSVVAGTTYYYAVYGNDGNDNYTPAVSGNAKILVTPALSVTPDNAKLNLSWASVTEASGYILVRKASSAPTFVPTNGVTYSTGAQGADTVVYVGTSTSFQDTGLTNGTPYYYKLYAYNNQPTYAAATSGNATPVAPCVTSTTPYTTDANPTVPASCTTLVIKAWGAGGGGGRKNSGTPGNGGGGGYATSTITVNAGTTIAIKVGAGGLCDGAAGTGYAAGGAGNAAAGSAGAGTASGGAAGSGGQAGGVGKYGGGGGGGNGSLKGGGGGGASSVTIDGTLSVVAGGGGGGGSSNVQFVVLPQNAGNGGAGCAQGGTNGAGNAGGGGGGGACLGTSANGSGVTPGNSAEAEANATGGEGATSSCGTANNGKNGMVTLTFSP